MVSDCWTRPSREGGPLLRGRAQGDRRHDEGGRGREFDDARRGLAGLRQWHDREVPLDDFPDLRVRRGVQGSDGLCEVGEEFGPADAVMAGLLQRVGLAGRVVRQAPQRPAAAAAVRFQLRHLGGEIRGSHQWAGAQGLLGIARRRRDA